MSLGHGFNSQVRTTCLKPSVVSEYYCPLTSMRMSSVPSITRLKRKESTCETEGSYMRRLYRCTSSSSLGRATRDHKFQKLTDDFKAGSFVRIYRARLPHQEHTEPCRYRCMPGIVSGATRVRIVTVSAARKRSTGRRVRNHADNAGINATELFRRSYEEFHRVNSEHESQEDPCSSSKRVQVGS